MMRTSKAVQRWIFGAGTVAALGFGGTQAMAAPAAVDAKVCDPAVCNRICQAIPGSIGGFCTSSGSCVCYVGG